MKKSFCRVCQAACALEVEVVGGRPVAVRGDRTDPIYGGYTCLKGRNLAEAHNHPERLRTSLRMAGSGDFEAFPTADAIRESGERLKALVDQYGPRSIGLFVGTMASYNSAVWSIVSSFMAGLGSPNFFTPITLDQPGKHLIMPSMGTWSGGLHGFADADVALIFGTNVLVSHYSPPGGIPPVSPSLAYRAAQERGTKVVVIDPRRSEVAARADIHLQIRPGQDVVLVAGMLNIIFAEELYDQAFCARYVDGLDQLRTAVELFDLAYVSERTGLDADRIQEVTRLFAAGPRGIATTGTGTEMGPYGRVNEFLVSALNLVLGRVNREGERPVSHKVLASGPPPRAQVIAPMSLWGEGFTRARVRNLTQVGGQMPCSTMADDILTPGEGKIRALIVIGGNPMLSFPNQTKVAAALEQLNLLVTIDPRVNQTAKRGHYVIAPSMCFEREDMTMLYEHINLYENAPYARYVERIAEPQGDVVDDWEVFWEWAQILGIDLALPGGSVPRDAKPSKFDVLKLITHGSPVPLEAVRSAAMRDQRLFPEAERLVEPGDPNNDARLQLMPGDLIGRLRAIRFEPAANAGATDHKFDLISRRIKHFMNSYGHNHAQLSKHGHANSAYLNPQDMQDLGLLNGQLVEVSNGTGRLIAGACQSPDVRQGTLSIAHGFGDIGEDVRKWGDSTNRLIDDEVVDPVTGLAQQSAVQVWIRALEPA